MCNCENKIIARDKGDEATIACDRKLIGTVTMSGGDDEWYRQKNETPTSEREAKTKKTKTKQKSNSFQQTKQAISGLFCSRFICFHLLPWTVAFTVWVCLTCAAIDEQNCCNLFIAFLFACASCKQTVDENRANSQSQKWKSNDPFNISQFFSLNFIRCAQSSSLLSSKWFKLDCRKCGIWLIF